MTAHLLSSRTDFPGGFSAANALVDSTPYEPELLIIGTFNPGGHAGNQAEFFYGRNYFWPVWAHIAGVPDAFRNAAAASGRRDAHLAAWPWDPAGNFPGIRGLCSQFRLTFADLVLATHVQVNGYSDKELNQFIQLGQADLNVANILTYVRSKPSLRYVYATTAFGQFGGLNDAWRALCAGLPAEIQTGKLLSPSGQGVGRNFAGLGRTATLGRHWVWQNTNAHPAGAAATQLLQRPNFDPLDRDWLSERGANPAVL
jgi:hypothetical protein